MVAAGLVGTPFLEIVFESAPKLCDFALLLHCFDILLKMCHFVLVFVVF